MIDIIPRPKEIREQSGTLSGTDMVLVDTKRFGDVAKVFAECGSELLGWTPGTRTGAGAPVRIHLSRSATGKAAEVLKRSDEAYVLCVTGRGVQIASRSNRGLVYGVHTLLYLVKVRGRRVTLPYCHIHDWPDYRMRGLQDDLARSQVSTIDNFKRIIRELSRLKYNVMTFHMEDMVRFDRHPDIGKDYGAMTKSQWRQLVEYGRRYGLKLFPTFQAFTHAGRVLNLPRYRKYSERPGRQGEVTMGCYCPTDKRVYDLLKDFFSELAEVFDDDTMHIGCDEVALSPTEGRSRDLVRKHGPLKVYCDHVIRVARLARKHWKHVLFFGDLCNARYQHSLGATVADAQRLHRAGLTFVNWDYYLYREEDYFHYVHFLNRCGVRQVISPGVWDWRHLFPSYSEMSRTLPLFTDVAYREGVRDAITCSWGDTVDAFREDNYLNYAYSAEHLWNAERRSDTQEQFTQRWAQQFFGVAPKPLVDAVAWLGKLNDLVYESARHDNRFPEPIGFSPFVAHMVFWNFPLPGSGLPEDAARSADRSKEADGWLGQMPALRKCVRRNRHNVDLIAYALRRGRWLFESVRYSARPTRSRAQSLAGDLRSLATDFVRLWDVTNIEPGRLGVEMRFDKLLACYEKEARRPSRWNGVWTPTKRTL